MADAGIARARKEAAFKMSKPEAELEKLHKLEQRTIPTAFSYSDCNLRRGGGFLWLPDQWWDWP